MQFSPCFHVPEYRPLNWIAPYLLAPLLGVPPGMYRLHHCIMHHGGNNRWQSDASSTERYQRDSLFYFFLCVGKEMEGLVCGLPMNMAEALVGLCDRIILNSRPSS